MNSESVNNWTGEHALTRERAHPAHILGHRHQLGVQTVSASEFHVIMHSTFLALQWIQSVIEFV